VCRENIQVVDVCVYAVMGAFEGAIYPPTCLSDEGFQDPSKELVGR
jgi:hypothetical protein